MTVDSWQTVFRSQLVLLPSWRLCYPRSSLSLSSKGIWSLHIHSLSNNLCWMPIKMDVLFVLKKEIYLSSPKTITSLQFTFEIFIKRKCITRFTSIISWSQRFNCLSVCFTSYSQLPQSQNKLCERFTDFRASWQKVQWLSFDDNNVLRDQSLAVVNVFLLSWL